jgi:hypothetical protein
MGKVCETCGQTRWEGRQVEGYVSSLRHDLEASRALLAEVYDNRLHNGGYVPSGLGDRIGAALGRGQEHPPA